MSTPQLDHVCLSAQYCDGVTPTCHTVEVKKTHDCLIFEHGGRILTFDCATLQRPEILANAPLVFELPNGATLQFDAVLCQSTLQGWGLLKPTWFEETLLKPWRWVAASCAALLVAFVLYFYALPGLASWGAVAVPQQVINRMFQDVMPILDQYYFQPSTMPQARQDALQKALGRLVEGQSEQKHIQLVFRSLPGAPNAFALPNGTIVLTDELAELLSDDAVMGVLAHEIGHVVLRHSLQALIQNGATATLLLAFSGDTSLLLTLFTTDLLNQKHSRDFELAADAFAIDRFKQQGRDLKHLEELYTVLLTLNGPGAGGGLGAYLSSHPASQERLELVRKAMGKPSR